jgi:hypothetical protein
LETEKRYLEMEGMQKKGKVGGAGGYGGDIKQIGSPGVNEELVRHLRNENNDLRIRLEESTAVGGAMRTSLMGSFGAGNLQMNAGSAFN